MLKIINPQKKTRNSLGIRGNYGNIYKMNRFKVFEAKPLTPP